MLDRLFNIFGARLNNSQVADSPQHGNLTDNEHISVEPLRASSLDDDLREHERSISGNEIGSMSYDYYDSHTNW